MSKVLQNSDEGTYGYKKEMKEAQHVLSQSVVDVPTEVYGVDGIRASFYGQAGRCDGFFMLALLQGGFRVGGHVMHGGVLHLLEVGVGLEHEHLLVVG